LFAPGPVTLSDSDPFGKTAMGALNKTGLPWQFSSQWDGMVQVIGGQRNEGMNGWCYKVNGENPMALARDYRVAAGSKIIWWYSNDAMSPGPDWNDLFSGQWTAAPKPQEAVDNLKVFKETLALYTGELENLKGKSKVINQERKMAAEQVKNRQEELAANIVSLKQEVGLSAAVVFDTAGEVSLLVPENALTQIRTLTVKELMVKEPDSSTVKFHSSGYEFGPAGLKFAKPVTIALKTAFVEGINYENLTPARYDHQADQWVPVPGIIDLEKQLVVFETSHFTRFAVIELPKEPVKRISFPDVGPELDWAKDAVEILAGKGILKGTANGFEPARPITRAEFTKLAVTALALPEAQATNDRFIDVNEADWFAGGVAAACKHNLITGYPDGAFRPGQAITRNEVAALFYRLQNQPADQPENPVVFADGDLIPAWAAAAVQDVIKQGLMQGYEDGTFRGNHPITRAEAAVVFYKYLLP
ncbi:MAG: S-layer homology domain-containing protein, partial [Heliobacteriaceae bacterium]|nr:S-layer homology domain-containing protein [Heliobacteriaceae bacterium]